MSRWAPQSQQTLASRSSASSRQINNSNYPSHMPRSESNTALLPDRGSSVRLASSYPRWRSRPTHSVSICTGLRLTDQRGPPTPYGPSASFGHSSSSGASSSTPIRSESERPLRNAAQDTGVYDDWAEENDDYLHNPDAKWDKRAVSGFWICDDPFPADPSLLSSIDFIMVLCVLR
jgi:hypothetical protein